MARVVTSAGSLEGLIDQLYGGVVRPEAFGKMNPDPSEVHIAGPLRARPVRRKKPVDDVRVIKKAPLTPEQRRDKLESNVARTSNVVGIAAGLAGTGSAYSQFKDARREAKGLPKPPPKVSGPRMTKLKGTRLVRAMGTKKGAAVLAGGGLALQVGNIVGDAVTTRVLARGAKRHEVEKVSMGQLRQGMKLRMQRATQGGTIANGQHVPPASGMDASNSGRQARQTGRNVMGAMTSTPAKVGAAAVAAGGIGMAAKGPGQPSSFAPMAPMQDQFIKSDQANDVVFGGTFSKFDEDKRLAFGWASVVEKDGLPVVDRQGDVISIDDIEEAAYTYVQKSRVGGEMHRRTADDQPHKIGEVVESVVFTKEKCKAMGLDDDMAGKWWIGMKVSDDETWQKAKDGQLAGFSIHGKGLRKSVDYDSLMMGG